MKLTLVLALAVLFSFSLADQRIILYYPSGGCQEYYEDIHYSEYDILYRTNVLKLHMKDGRTILFNGTWEVIQDPNFDNEIDGAKG